MLSQEELPENLLPKCMDVLRELSASERDLIRVCVEIVHELRDPKEDEEEEDPNVSSRSAIFTCPRKLTTVFDQ
jgi:condensin complex subunit 3